LKPPDMITALVEGTGEDDQNGRPQNADAYWPLSCEKLQGTTIEIISFHFIPKRGEQRPHYAGHRGGCHNFHPELSGPSARPTESDPSSPVVIVSLHPIGGFCACHKTLPVPLRAEAEVTAAAIKGNGLNATLRQEFHCVATDPHATFLKVAVTDGGHEVAYETAVQGRLRSGYRVMRLRSSLGTRIELACLLLRISTGSEHENLWMTGRQLRLATRLASSRSVGQIVGLREESRRNREELAILREENAQLNAQLGAHKRSLQQNRPHGRSKDLVCPSSTDLGTQPVERPDAEEGGGGSASCLLQRVSSRQNIKFPLQTD